MKQLEMKVAIPHWQDRVSPVFDVAGSVLVVELENGVERGRQDVEFDAEDIRARAARLAKSGADVLICGAISRPLEMAVASTGIEVIPQTCGGVDNVLRAYVDGRLAAGAFLMPGCCGRRRLRARRGRGFGRRGSRPPAQQQPGA